MGTSRPVTIDNLLTKTLSGSCKCTSSRLYGRLANKRSHTALTCKTKEEDGRKPRSGYVTPNAREFWIEPDDGFATLLTTSLRPGTYPFSSDQGCQTGLGSTSTRLSDRPGTLSAVVSFVFKLACCVCIVCSVSCLHACLLRLHSLQCLCLHACLLHLHSVQCLLFHACLLHLHSVQSTEI